MNAGVYKHLVIIERLVNEQDESGFTSKQWTEYYRNYAYINQLSGTERWNAAQVQMDTTVRFMMRYHAPLRNVKPKYYRILTPEDGKIYIITFVDNVRRENNTVKIDALEVEA